VRQGDRETAARQTEREKERERERERERGGEGRGEDRERTLLNCAMIGKNKSAEMAGSEAAGCDGSDRSRVRDK